MVDYIFEIVTLLFTPPVLFDGEDKKEKKVIEKK